MVTDADVRLIDFDVALERDELVKRSDQRPDLHPDPVGGLVGDVEPMLNFLADGVASNR
jgi:hypothetical protein